jgi:ribosomal protein S18 acetylase RimI-like enzyme
LEARSILRGAAPTFSPGEALDPRVMYAAFNADRCVGYIAGHLTTRYDSEGELQWIYVTPARRGTEVAHVLLRHLAVWLVERNARRVCVDVEPENEIARRFYAKHRARSFKPYWMMWDDIAAVL